MYACTTATQLTAPDWIPRCTSAMVASSMRKDEFCGGVEVA